MSRLRLASRRVLAVAATASLGLVGAAVIASPAQAHHPEVAGQAHCPDPATGEWSVDWTVTSWKAEWDNAEQYKIIEVKTVPEGASSELPTGEWRDMSQSFTGTQTLTGDVEFAKITVTAKWDNGKTGQRSGRVDRPDPCEVPEKPAPVDVNATESCEGLAVDVVNPEDGAQTEYVLTPSDGEAATGTVAPGRTATHSFDAGDDGLTVTVAVGDETADIAWTKPDNCDEPSGEGGSEEKDEELPVTGFQTGAAVVGAALLLALGAGLFLVARRRRITFTA